VSGDELSFIGFLHLLVDPGIGFIALTKMLWAVEWKLQSFHDVQDVSCTRFGFELELYSKCRRCSRCVGRISGGRCVAWNSLYLKAEQSLEENVFRLILDKIYYADKSWKEISF